MEFGSLAYPEEVKRCSGATTPAGPYCVWVRVLAGQRDPNKAVMVRKLKVKSRDCTSARLSPHRS